MKDIKNIASAYKQVLEKKLDAVNPDELKGTHAQRKDKDINNDGKVDSSDEYLHNRRKAITKAIHKEELDLSDFSVKEWEEFMESEEYDQLDEISKKTLGSYIKKATPSAMNHGVKGMDFKNDNQPKHFNKAMQRMTGIKRAADKLVAKEEVEELDELSKKTLGSYRKAKPGLSEAKDGDGANIVRDKKFKGKSLLGKTPVPYKPANPDGPHYSTGKKSMKKKDTDMSMKEKLQLQKESILEREMTDAEMKKREDIIMGMKKNKADLEKRYGSRWKDVMYATATKQAMESVDNALAMTKNLLTTKESFKTETTTWPVYARIKENLAAHYKGAAPGDPKMMDKMTASDKAFIAVHNANDLDGIDSGIDGAKAAEYTAKNATTGIKPGAGMNRTGDQKIGDKNIIKSTEAK